MGLPWFHILCPFIPNYAPLWTCDPTSFTLVGRTGPGVFRKTVFENRPLLSDESQIANLGANQWRPMETNGNQWSHNGITMESQWNHNRPLDRPILSTNLEAWDHEMNNSLSTYSNAMRRTPAYASYSECLCHAYVMRQISCRFHPHFRYNFARWMASMSPGVAPWIFHHRVEATQPGIGISGETWNWCPSVPSPWDIWYNNIIRFISLQFIIYIYIIIWSYVWYDMICILYYIYRYIYIQIYKVILQYVMKL